MTLRLRSGHGICLAVTLALVSSTFSLRAQGPSVVGSWKLVHYDRTTSAGGKTFPLGEDAVGQLIYLANGRMSVHLMRRDRPRFASGDSWRGTFEEERAAFEGSFSYAGRYTIDAARGMVTHHIEIASAPNEVGTDVVRTFTMEGNRITLKTPQRLLAGQASTSTLIWERIE